MKRKGPWSTSEIQEFLAASAVPMRLACNGASGTPVMASLWFVPLDGKLWCATQQGASVLRHLERDPRCAFEVAHEHPPYRGVRGQGRAALHAERGADILRRVAARYLEDLDSDFARWLFARADTETAIAVDPTRVLSWDFTERMRGAE